MDGVSAASISPALASAYDMAMIRKSMDSMESQAESLINDMLAAVSLPSAGMNSGASLIDVYV